MESSCSNVSKIFQKAHNRGGGLQAVTTKQSDHITNTINLLDHVAAPKRAREDAISSEGAVARPKIQMFTDKKSMMVEPPPTAEGTRQIGSSHLVPRSILPQSI
jgi:hypothetical protein